MTEGRSSKLFYGWVIVGLAFVVQFVAAGALFQCFPVFLLPLADEFGLGRAQAALPPVAMMTAGIVISPIIGVAVSRFPIRNVMLVGALAMSLGFLWLSQATAYWQILLGYGIAGPTALGALGAISCNTLIVNWFERRRAFALGVAMIGMSISGAVVIPIASWGVEEWGWRAVYQFFAIEGLALMPLIGWLVVSRPEDMGLAADGEAGPAERVLADNKEEAEPSSVASLLAAPTLWLIGATCGLAFFGALSILNHGIAFAVDRGIDPMRAAGLLSMMSIGAASGKLVFGWLSDRLGEKAALAIALALEFIGFLGLWGLTDYASLVAIGALFGLGLGGVAPLQAALLARVFGSVDFSRVMGLVAPLMIPFQVAGPPLAGWIYDTRGSYDQALWVFMATTVAAGIALAFLRLPPVADAAAAKTERR